MWKKIYPILWIYLAYAVPTNLLLVTRFFPWLASEGKDRSFNIRYSMAWTLVPGIVHIRSLVLNGTDANVFWKVQIGEIRFVANLYKLTKRELSLSYFRAADTQVEIHQHDPAKRAYVQKKQEEDSKKMTPSEDPWLVKIEDIRLDSVRHVSLDSFYYSGNSDIQGSFILWPGRYLEIPESRWTIRDGLLKTNDVLVLREIEGNSIVRIYPTALDKMSGSEIFNTMDISQNAHSLIFDAQVFGALVKDYRPMVFGKTEGEMNTLLEVKKGVLQPGTEIKGVLKKLDLKLAGASLYGEGGIDWKVLAAQGNDVPISKLNFWMDTVDWKGNAGTGGKPTVLAKGKNFRVRAESRDLSLVSPFEDQILRFKILDAQIASLQDLMKHLLQNDAKSYSLLSSNKGSLDFEGRIHPAKKDFRGEIGFRSDAMEFSHNEGKTKIHANLKNKIRVSSRDYENGMFNIDEASFDLSNVEIENENKQEYSADNWKIGFQILKGRLRTEPMNLDGKLVLNMSNARIPARYLLPDNFWAPIALFFYPMKNFTAESELHVNPRGFAVQKINANSSSGKIFGETSVVDGIPQMYVFFELVPVDVCLSKPAHKDVNISLMASRDACVARKLAE